MPDTRAAYMLKGCVPSNVETAFRRLSRSLRVQWGVTRQFFYAWVSTKEEEAEVERVVRECSLQTQKYELLRGDAKMSTRIEVKGRSLEHAHTLYFEMSKHWAVRSIEWDTGSQISFAFEADNRPAKHSISNILRSLKATFELIVPVRTDRRMSEIPIAQSPLRESVQRAAAPIGRKRGKISKRPSNEDFLRSLKERGVEETAERYGVSPLTVRYPWAKAVLGARALIADLEKEEAANVKSSS